MIGRKDLIGDPRFDTAAARLGHEQEVDDIISAWTRQHTKEQAMRIIGEAKIPVGAVRDTRDLYDDPDFENRGLMQAIDQPIPVLLTSVG